MTSYCEKKPHIYAYRRRKAAANYIKKLSEIAQKSNEKDLGLIIQGISSLHLDIEMNLLRIYDDLPRRGEGFETQAQKLNEKITRDVFPVPRYVCPLCHKLGFLYSPNLGLEGRTFRRFIVHIEWPRLETRFCEVSPTKTKWIRVEEPNEGVFALH